MKPETNYSVAFTGLKNGVHSFTYIVNDAFFTARPYSPIKAGRVNIELEFEKNDSFFALSFAFKGEINTACDRCTSAIALPVNHTASLIVKFSEMPGESTLDETVLYLAPNEVSIDLSQYIYETLVVNVPLHKTCDDDVIDNKTCDENVTKFLAHTALPAKEPDPRWNKLNELKKEYGTSKK